MIVPLDTMTAVTMATRLRERDVREVVCTEWHDDPATWAAGMAARRAPAYAILDDKTRLPVAMGGAIVLWPGVAQTWLAAADEMPRYTVELVRAVHQVHKALAADGIRRFQTYCLHGFATGRRFLQRFGYRYEGLCLGMGKRGEDIEIMARLEAR
jgi:hypothetical protein